MEHYGISEIFFEDDYKIGILPAINSNNQEILPYRIMYIGKQNSGNHTEITKMEDGWYHIVKCKNTNFPEVHIDAFRFPQN
jgi:hypothetical protein